ncbi:DUF3302 domain-containing protein [Ruegeria sp. HKCCD4884]|uniref:DUF3302 domain-containing protein n=1 Tax=Ruegeria sp. HKCCD4884 TaxID=2683022 RepID=UPI001491E99F|nr:DUF3302 domain-containing protein [Ruegeria sp. HKCCD4884]
MSGLDIFAWVVLIVLIFTAIVGFVVLAMLPGKIAAQRGHPQADAINVAGWVGALLLGVLWPLALIWAYTRSPFKTQLDLEDPTLNSKEKGDSA